MAEPKAVLAEYDMPVPDGIDVKVMQDSDDCARITLPASTTGDIDLTDDEMSRAAGGDGCKCHECHALHSQPTFAHAMQ